MLHPMQLNLGNEPGLLSWTFSAPRWYAAYTSANHEKRVAEQLEVRSVENFLPTYSSVRRWKDRRVTLQLPLFPGYVFLRMSLRDKLKVVQVPGLARLVGFDGTPAALSDEEVGALRSMIQCGSKLEPHPFLNVGRRVYVRNGPMAGMLWNSVAAKGQAPRCHLDRTHTAIRFCGNGRSRSATCEVARSLEAKNDKAEVIATQLTE